MTDILIGRVGKIISGDEQGRYIKVVDDAENTGGFLILIADDIEFRSGYDNWVEDKDALNRYFLECEWLINWSR
ncbi:hypothetical protein HYN46_15005 [Aquirhabdus parva]|uniref:Uncharacterized protein n=2 Tax=Aquirhabdus parva TaxID=2283318 RepID=A0A345PBS1_9GAMM|nr:hypothetical protein HYN46_15005 [Aquirhabdus parva]